MTMDLTTDAVARQTDTGVGEDTGATFTRLLEATLQKVQGGQGTASATPSADLMASLTHFLQQESRVTPEASNTAAVASSAPALSGTPEGPVTGSGPNVIEITNTQDHAIQVGKFKNGESTTDPSAAITLQPGETGKIYYQNGEAGYMAQADAAGQYQPDASRLEYQADADGVMKYPDVSYIDGRNAAISLTDGADFQKGDSQSIADRAPSDIVHSDSAGNKTIAGWYDGSDARMQQGGAFMEQALGMAGAYIHPDDDRRELAANPMSATQSNVLKATFGAA